MAARGHFGNLARDQRLPPPRMKAYPKAVRELMPRERPTDLEEFAPIELADHVRAHLRPVNYDGDSALKGRVNEIVGWDQWDMPKRVAFLRSFVEDTARDPAIAQKAIQIIRAARVPQRDHEGEWKALLKWVQRNIRFTAEPNERIQSPQYTLTNGYGDCDDMGIVLAALAHSIRLPWRFAIQGRNSRDERVRWIEKCGPCPTDANWTHILVAAGWPTFRPEHWKLAEPTLDVPLGWDSFKEQMPSGRADLSGRGDFADSDIAKGAAKTEAAPVEETWTEKGKRGVKALPWPNIAGAVVSSVISYILVQHLVAPKMAKARSKR